MTKQETDFVPTPGARTLVLVFHGIGARLEALRDVRETIERELGEDADILMPRRWRNIFSNADPVAITRDAVLQVDAIMKSHPYERIILVGYSAGGIFARKFVVYAHPEEPSAPFEEDAKVLAAGQRWAPKIERIVLLAGMNRGWSFAPTVNPFFITALRFAYGVLRVFPGVRLGASLRRGAPFVSDLRNQWLALTRTPRLDALMVVQLLGTIDDVVSPDDNVDTETGGTFFYLDVPCSGHANVRKFKEGPFGPFRKKAFVSALTDSRETLDGKSLPPPPPNYGIDASVQHLLFVIHGIRDNGFWTAHLARHIVEAARKEKVPILALTPTYGYFAMLPFLIPSTRHAKIRWFMEQYTEALARFPNAQSFSYIAHSNGTYLLAGALTSYATCHFDRVLFAGSVVRTPFPWQSYIDTGRVKAVMNYVADADWVVALFPRFLAKLGADVGGAGWDGFTPDEPDEKKPVNDIEYVAGGHFTALREEHWSDIANFILGKGLPARQFKKKHDWFVGSMAAVSLIIWILLIGVILGPPIVLFYPWPCRETSCWPSVVQWSLGARAFLSFLWLMLMRAVLTRF